MLLIAAYAQMDEVLSVPSGTFRSAGAGITRTGATALPPSTLARAKVLFQRRKKNGISVAGEIAKPLYYACQDLSILERIFGHAAHTAVLHHSCVL